MVRDRITAHHRIGGLTMRRRLGAGLALPCLASALLRAENAPRWSADFKEEGKDLLTVTGQTSAKRATRGETIPGSIQVSLPPDVDPATMRGGVRLGRIENPRKHLSWVKPDEYTSFRRHSR